MGWPGGDRGTPLVLALPGNERLATALAGALDAEVEAVHVRAFPDGESLVRVPVGVTGRRVVLVCTLDRPDPKVVPLVLAATATRELGAAAVGLVAPYLAYMRQDTRFHPGDAVSSITFARVLSGVIDWLVAVDPHLHRHPALASIYGVPVAAVAAAPALAAWIRTHVTAPVLLGPDIESAQWVTAVAALVGAPHLVLEKTRHSDHEVEVSAPEAARVRGCTPVIVDDIVSTAGTMSAAAARLRDADLAPPVCIGVHGVFADGAEGRLADAGVARVVTTNTIPHATNAIDVAPLVAAALRPLLAIA